MDYNLLFFTAATGRYKIFITPYIFFALYHNPNAKAEIMTDNVSDYLRRNAAADRVLGRMFAGRYIYREIPRGIEPHTARFVVEPVTHCKYTYANDVDILILESDVVETHEAILAERNSIFSNRMRGTNKLTGVHFVKTDPYYGLTRVARQQNKLMDEQALYDIVKKGVGEPQKYTSDKRPIHGFHVSMNRPPVPAHEGQAAWKTGPEPLREIYRATIKTRQWAEVFPTFNERFKEVLKTLNGYVL
ncbi:MAG: hypothetical protein KJ604_20945 [Gammaproteobacteria bacterium]|nr:hypothetical protein [Gammaproteobacteria bacterium]